MITLQAPPSRGFRVSWGTCYCHLDCRAIAAFRKALLRNSFTQPLLNSLSIGALPPAYGLPPRLPRAPSPHQSSSPLLRGRIRLVLCDPRAQRHQRNSRIPASGAPRRFLWCRFRALVPTSSPDPAPKQQPTAPRPRHRPCTQINRQRPHPYFFTTLQPRRLLPLRLQGTGAAAPAQSLRCGLASVGRTDPTRSAYRNPLRKSMTAFMVRSWTMKHSPPDKRPSAQNADGALLCAPSVLEN